MTGTFDNWAQSVKLDLADNGFSKEVELPDNQKIHYKVRRSRCFSAFPSILQCSFVSSLRCSSQ